MVRASAIRCISVRLGPVIGRTSVPRTLRPPTARPCCGCAAVRPSADAKLLELMRITAVTTTVPGPRKPRLLSFIQALRLAGHSVSVVATSDLSQGGGSDDGLAILEPLGVSVERVPFAPHAPQLARAASAVLSRRSCSETALYDSRRLAELVASAVGATRPDVLHVDRLRALSLIRYSRVPAVVDITDPRVAAYQHYRRSGSLSPLRVGVAELIRAWLDQGPARREEVTKIRGIPALVSSEGGRQTLLRFGIEPGLVWQVPNAVFPEERAEPLRGPGGGNVIGMSGNLSYPPNVLGFDSFAKEIVPRLRDEMTAKVVLVGSDPHRLLVRRAEQLAVEIHRDVASVPRTIRELGVSVMVSPQRVSGGFPNRVVDAVYRAGVPIVCSRETVWGIPDVLAGRLPVASTPEDWLRQTRASVAGDAGAELVVELQQLIDDVCGPQAVTRALTAAYEHALSEPGGVAAQARA